MAACLKQMVTCRIVRADGRVYEATNSCNVDGLTECPRVTAGCKTGEGYELCGPPVHAEVAAAALAAESIDVPGEAFLAGHDYLCEPCQKALTAINVRTFHIEPVTALRLGEMKRTFCDFCEEEITADPLYRVVLDKGSVNEIAANEVCGYCASRVRALKEPRPRKKQLTD